MISKRLKEIDRSEKLPGGIVIYGGGAKMPFITELAKERLNLPVRVAKPEIDWYKDSPDLSFVPALGLLFLKLQSQRQGISLSSEEGVIKKLVNFFRNSFSI